MKTSAKYFRLVVGPYARKHEPKWPKAYLTYNITKKLKPKTFFQCRLNHLLSLWTAL